MFVKKVVGVLRAISGSPNPKNFTSAIIAAAGLSERFGGTETKQMTKLCGTPVLLHTLKAFENTECIHEIIIVAKENEIPYWQEDCKEYKITKLTKIVVGADTRQKSVMNGLEAVDERSKFVAIADGARCLITPEQITSVCRSAYKYKAATAAHRATDTVKVADSKGFIDSTADRNSVWLAQTPQVFKTKLYRAAAVIAVEKKFEGTDDNSLVEFIRHPIRLVECGSQNIKITTYDDLAAARGILKVRKALTPEIYYGTNEE
jgi:2-C-methyl-D-erythritol 4-phosphate cytidylyltransferase